MLDKIKQLKHHQGFMKYFKNTSWLFGEKILRMVVGLFVSIWVTRYLGPEKFGLFSYAQSFAGLFTAVSTLGIDGILVRELVKKENKRDVLMGTAFGLKLIGALLSLIILAIAVYWTSNDQNTGTIILIIASATIFQSFNVIDFYFQSKVISKYTVYANSFSLFLSSVVKITLILYEAPLVYFAYAILFDSVILAMGFLYFYLYNNLSIKKWRFDRREAKALLKDSWPLMFTTIVLVIQARIDQVMLKEMMGSKEVGYYSSALRLIEVFGFIPMMLSSSLSPSIIKSKEVSYNFYQDRLLNFYRLNFLLFLVIAIPIFIFAEQIVTTLYGTEFQNAGILLALMALRLFFANMGVARSNYILIENLFKFSLVTMILGTITNVVLNYFWITSYGSKGAIAASMVSFFVTIFAVDILYFKTRGNIKSMLFSMLTFHKIRIQNDLKR